MGEKFTKMKPIDKKEVARLTQELDSLQQQRSEYMAGLEPISKALRETESKLAAALSAFEVNEHVIWRDGSKEKKAIIAKIEYDYGKPRYYVYVLKKDNTPGIRLFRVWGSWRHNDVLRPDPGASSPDNNIPASPLGGSGVVQDVGDSGACARVSTPGMKRTSNPPVGWR